MVDTAPLATPKANMPLVELPAAEPPYEEALAEPTPVAVLEQQA